MTAFQPNVFLTGVHRLLVANNSSAQTIATVSYRLLTQYQ